MREGLEILFLLTVFGVILFYLFRLPTSTAFGSAGFTTPEKERDLLCQIERGLSPGEVFLGPNNGKSFVRLPKDMALQHGIICAGSGAGKSRGYFLPNAALSTDSSLVCTDPKGELWRLTSGFHKTALRFSPIEPECSHTFNWIPLCSDPRLSYLGARAIIECGNTSHTDQAWIELETAFLAGLFSWASRTPIPTPLTVERLLSKNRIGDLIDELYSSPSEMAQEQGIALSDMSERMRSSVVSVVRGRVSFLKDPRIQRFTSSELYAPDFGSLRHEPSAIYWCLREQDIKNLMPLTTLFFTFCLEGISSEDLAVGEEGAPVLMLLDEFANIGVIPDFSTTISVCRGRGIGIWLACQAISQLEARYGKANAQTILSNCSTKIALSGLDVDTAQYFSRSLGETTVVTRKRARHTLLTPLSERSQTLTEAEHGRALMTADEVRRLTRDEALVITGNRKPMRLKKLYYDEAPCEAEAPVCQFPRALTYEPQKRVSQRRELFLLPPPKFPKEL